jgi:hypothetical protein
MQIKFINYSSMLLLLTIVILYLKNILFYIHLQFFTIILV